MHTWQERNAPSREYLLSLLTGWLGSANDIDATRRALIKTGTCQKCEETHLLRLSMSFGASRSDKLCYVILRVFGSQSHIHLACGNFTIQVAFHMSRVSGSTFG